MAIGHLAVRPHSRRKGHSAAAALAYRHGARLIDKRTGEIHNYVRRGRNEELAQQGLVAPGNWPLSGDTTADLQRLADAIEASEKRKDACILRDVQIALPHELESNRQAHLANAYAKFIGDRYITVVTWAIHRPAKPKKKTPPEHKSDPRNIHAHLILPGRTVESDGTFGAKLRVLDAFDTGPKEVAALRNAWQALANHHLVIAGSDSRVHVGRRLDAEPEPTLSLGTPKKKIYAARVAHKEKIGDSTPVYAPEALTARDRWLLEKGQKKAEAS